MTHPDPARLLDVALGGETARPETGRHLARCAECRAEVARLRTDAVEVGLDSSANAGPDCLGPSTLASVAGGAPGGPARSADIEHLAGCGHCQAALADLMSLLDSPEVRRELARSRGSTGRRILRIGAALAAAAVLVIVVSRPFGSGGGANHRSPPSPQVMTPTLLGPVGEVAVVDSLAWRAIAGSDWYRVTVFDAHGGVVLEREGPDTVLVVPDPGQFKGGETYLWRVEARVGWGRWVGTPLIRFTLVNPSR